MTAIFLFRRDLRLHDNTGLIECLRNYNVIPIFIFDPKQVKTNEYKSDNCIQFMVESLKDLEGQIENNKGKLHYFHGNPATVIGRLVRTYQIDAVYANRDYTPYSKQRDLEISKKCKLVLFEDILLSKYTGKTYVKFTPFKNKVLQTLNVDEPRPNKYTNYVSIPSENVLRYKVNKDLAVNGGRKRGLVKLKQAVKLTKYETLRDFMSQEYTTQLSAYNKFGCLSIREIYYKVKSNKALINELLWRDFYYLIIDKHPVLSRSLNPKYDKIKWTGTKFKEWKEGRTGFPIVDAGMRQMNKTGYMHNRCRMITSSFLVKVLGVDWRKGEKYFATKLVDYDPAQNNGGWQWSMGGGADSQPYFRVFNPWLQSKKYDKNTKYIKQWIPELKDVEPKHIHEWNIYYDQYNVYYRPIVDYSEAKNKVQQWYKKI